MKRVLMYSGGWDSTCASYLYPDAEKIYVDLHSKYSEVEKANLPGGVRILDLDLCQFTLPDGYHVPQRNAILALLGAATAMKDGEKDIDIYICGMKEDLTAPDKNPSYFELLSQLASAFDPTGEYHIKVKGFFDDDKISLWEKAGKPDIRNVISCYSGDNCGECLACKRRLLYLNYIYPEEYEIDGGAYIKELENEGWIVDERIKNKWGS